MKHNKYHLQGQSYNKLFTEYLVATIEKIFNPIPVPIILLDNETKIKIVNNVLADYLGCSKNELIGKRIKEVDKETRFPYVFKSKKAEIDWERRFENGNTAIVHTIPILNEANEVECGIGLILFKNQEQLKDIIEKNKLLKKELHIYGKRLKKSNRAKYSWENIIGNSEKMAEAKYMAKKAAQTNSNVLLLGESGSGKELFAHSIHNGSKRKHLPFVKVDCVAIPSELLESELFGYEEGAFTGARKGGKIGKFETANGGSIFLDEIGDMPLTMQAKLLRVLQEKEFERVGGTTPINLDIRFIAATNKNLKELVKEGKFREDLYYRLNVMTIHIPGLRERHTDIEDITYSLIKKLSKQLGKYVSDISRKALDYIRGHNWPGNVRELANVLERAINLTDSDIILPVHLPVYLIKENGRPILDDPVRPLKDIIESIEKEAIVSCLKYTKGNKLKTAKLLDISRSSLYDKIERYGI